MYGRSHPRNLFPTKQTFRVSCFPSKGFMFSLSRQLQGFHMPPLISNQSGQQPVSNVSCSFLSGRAVPRKPLLSWLLRNPLGQPPVAQCRRTGEIKPRLTREGHIAICMISGRAVPKKPLSFQSKQVLMRTHGRRATTIAPARCITNKSCFRNWLHHPQPPIRRTKASLPRTLPHSSTKRQGLGHNAISKATNNGMHKYDHWQGGT